MKTLIQTERIQSEAKVNEGFEIDTTFVLFFLAVEFGQTLNSFGFETILTAITLAALLILPYFVMPSRPSFGNWLAGRGVIAAFAIVLGVAFNQTLGVVLPETFRFLPMTLLIVTAMASCYFQFYGFFKLRMAK